jgi:comEA protein
VYLTKAQIRALWFVIGVLTAAIFYQYVKYYTLSNEPYDFSAFDSLFQVRKDSIFSQLSSPDTLTPQRLQQQHTRSSETVVIQQFPININNANLEELQVLPKIGPAMAKRIIDYRQANGAFKSTSEIKNVKGIGEKTYLKLQDLISVK